MPRKRDLAPHAGTPSRDMMIWRCEILSISSALVELRVEPLLQLRNQFLDEPRGFIVPDPPRERFVSVDLFLEPLQIVFLMHGESRRLMLSFVS
jgi:hypothetical protein